jgi:hypothetical protein
LRAKCVIELIKRKRHNQLWGAGSKSLGGGSNAAVMNERS